MRRTGIAYRMGELIAVALLLLSVGVWLFWMNSHPRARALQHAPAWNPDSQCEVMTVVPWRRGQRYARCWPLGLPEDHPVAFAGLHLVIVGAVGLVVWSGRHRRARIRIALEERA